MRVQFNFKPIKFNSPDELFTKPDSYELRLPNEEPMGSLTTQDGKTSFIEFIYEDEELSDESFIGQAYKGPGIYLLDFSENDDKGNDIPFWVVLPKGTPLTVHNTKSILEKIESVLNNEEYKQANVWTLS